MSHRGRQARTACGSYKLVEIIRLLPSAVKKKFRFPTRYHNLQLRSEAEFPVANQFRAEVKPQRVWTTEKFGLDQKGGPT
jgi:hypothetical protein